MSRKPLVPKFALMHFECDNSISVVLTKSVDWLEFGKLGHCKDGAKRPVGRVLKMAGKTSILHPILITRSNSSSPSRTVRK